MEKENEMIYDLELSEISEKPDNREQSENSENQEPSEGSENTEDPQNIENPDDPKSPSAAETEIQRMVDDMGAERVLEIIRDNRNEAIRQIISEMETSQERVLRSGTSIRKECNSIFDLAAMA